jgi:hypothetical protein
MYKSDTREYHPIFMMCIYLIHKIMFHKKMSCLHYVQKWELFYPADLKVVFLFNIYNHLVKILCLYYWLINIYFLSCLKMRKPLITRIASLSKGKLPICIQPSSAINCIMLLFCEECFFSNPMRTNVFHKCPQGPNTHIIVSSFPRPSNARSL